MIYVIHYLAYYLCGKAIILKTNDLKSWKQTEKICIIDNKKEIYIQNGSIHWLEHILNTLFFVQFSECIKYNRLLTIILGYFSNTLAQLEWI